MTRIYLSPPHMSGLEQGFVQETFASNWIAPLGPQVDAFEAEFAAVVGAPYALALSSGTAALHLALLLAGVGPGDEVLVSTLTFSASANPIVYLGGRPTFIDSERTSWNMDPVLLAETLDARACAGRLPKAVIPVHLYGQSADMAPILAACERHGVPVIEDAAEALGATYGGPVARSQTGHSDEASSDESGKSWKSASQTPGRAPGALGWAGIFSFNGNKIITTSGGGMLVSADKALIDHARKLATQARDPAPHYQHSEIGYNYRLSNVLAAIGRGQLRVLAERVRRKREIFEPTAGSWATCLASALCPRRPGAAPPAGSPASPWTRRSSARTARRSAWRWRRRTSSRGRCGSRCICSRCLQTVRSWAARWPRTCLSVASVCPPARP